MKTQTIECRYDILSFDELTPAEQELVERAKEATRTSYAPYSTFCVGAALRLSNGTIVTGSNQENCAYPSGLCAERTTVFYAHAHYPECTMQTLAIAAYTQGEFCASPVTPCGSCRQVLIEYEKQQGSDIALLLYGSRAIYRVHNTRSLLPLQFDSLDS